VFGENVHHRLFPHILAPSGTRLLQFGRHCRQFLEEFLTDWRFVKPDQLFDLGRRIMPVIDGNSPVRKLGHSQVRMKFLDKKID